MKVDDTEQLTFVHAANRFLDLLDAGYSESTMKHIHNGLKEVLSLTDSSLTGTTWVGRGSTEGC